MSHRKKILLLWLAKLSLAFFLLDWLIRSGRMDLKQILKVTERPLWLALAAIITVALVPLSALRWQTVLKSVGVRLPFHLVHRFAWIGQFCSNFLPGSLGGDASRIVMVCRKHPENRAMAAFSVLIDRGLGLLALLALSSFSYFLIPAERRADQNLEWLASLPMIAAISVSAGIAGLFLVKVRLPFLDRFRRRLPKPDRRLFFAMAVVFSLAVIYHLGVVLIFYCLLRAQAPVLPIGLHQLCFVVPLGMLVMVLPLAPAGVGVGQAAFTLLFSILGVPQKDLGANSVSALQILFVAVNALGVFPFLRSRGKGGKKSPG